VRDAEILARHFDARRDRFPVTTGSILILHDTTEHTYQREDGRGIGHLGTALSWRIENFHKTSKSGCRTEQSKLRTAERIVNLMAMFCILSWRIFWLTMISRAAGNANPEIVLTPLEIDLLN